MIKLPFSFTLLLLLSQLHSSCNTLNNRMDEAKLNCGPDWIGGQAYFVVFGPNGQRLRRDEFDLIDLKTDHPLKSVSRNGCVPYPQQGKYLLRGTKAEWAKFIDTSTLQLSGAVNLQNYGNQSLAIVCDVDSGPAVNTDFELQTFIQGSIRADMRNAYALKWRLLDKDKTLRDEQELPLSEMDAEVKPLRKLKEEGDYTIELSISNRIRKTEFASRSCPIKLDKTPPLAQFLVNAKSKFEFLAYRQYKDIVVIQSGDSVQLSADEADVAELHYCLQAIRDFVKEGETQNCTQPWTREKSSRVVIPAGDGFWLLQYYAKDRQGNESPKLNRVFLRFHGESVELIRSLALGTVSANLLQGRTLEALQTALKAYRHWMKLPTDYERSLVKTELRSALLKVFHQNQVDLEMREHGSLVNTILATPDGRLIASSDESKTLRFWDAKTGKILKTHVMPHESIYSQAVTSDSKFLVAGSGDQRLRVWNLETLELVKEYMLHDAIMLLAVSDDLKTAAYSMRSGSIEVWDLENSELLFTLEGDATLLRGMAIDKSGTRLAAAFGKDVSVWNLKDGSKIRTFPAHAESVNWVTWVDQDSRVLSVAADEVRISDLDSDEVRSFRLNSGGGRIAMNDKKSLIAYQDSGNDIVIFDLASEKILQTFKWNENNSTAFAFLTGQEGLLVGSNSGRIVLSIFPKGFYHRAYPVEGNLLDWEIRKPALGVRPPPSYSNSSWSLENSELLEKLSFLSQWTRPEPLGADFRERVSYAENMVSIHDLKTGTLKQKIDVGKSISRAALSPNGQMLVTLTSSNSDFELQLWDVPSGTKIKNLGKLDRPGFTLKISGEGELIVGHIDGTISVWNFRSGERRIKWKAHTDRPDAMLISRDSKTLYTGARDNWVRVWDLQTGRKKAEFGPHQEWVLALALMEDENVLLASGKDADIRFWDLDSGEGLNSIMRLRDAPVAAILHDSSNDRLVSVEEEGQVVLWDLDIHSLRGKLCDAFRNLVEKDLCE